MASPVKRFFQNLCLAGCSILTALLFLELISRFLIEPVDFLRPQLIDHPILRHVIPPGSGGHDLWGFRNRLVPASAKIVAIGDSQTYGASAAAKDSWPAHLSELTKQSVYNLSLGGYGPAQYFHLLTSKAVKLGPEVVIVGFYLGNDLLETYESVHRNPHWAWLGGAGSSAPFGALANPVTPAPPKDAPAAFLPGLRTWLAQRSILYNVLIYSALGEIARVMESFFVLRQSAADGDVRYDKGGIHTGFTPERRLQALDLNDPRVHEGLLISLELFERMKRYCLERAIHLLVVLIPTKESVYAGSLERDPPAEKITAIKSLLMNERTVTAAVKAFFEDHGIAYVNVLPELQRRAARLALYPGNFDGHPNRQGYLAIAQTVEQYLRRFAPAAGVAGKLVPGDTPAGDPTVAP